MQLVTFIPTGDDRYAYWRSLSAAWATQDVIVNVEWDMQVSESLILGLLACPHPLCTHAYGMHLPIESYAHGWVADESRGSGMGVEWIAHGEEWANWSGIGFCKVAPGVRTGTHLARNEWPGVETSVNNAITGLWHVHWPAINHYHT